MNRRKTKECLGCGVNFLTYKNYDYCVNCAVNQNRYLSPASPCSECDGSGVIKFKNHKPRPCQLCSLTKKTMPNLKKTDHKKLTIWEEVDQKTHYLIADILQQILPIKNIRQNFTPHADADYRSLLVDFEDQLNDFNLSELKLRLKENHPEPLTEQIAYEYFLLVIKSLVERLRDFGCHSEEYLNF